MNASTEPTYTDLLDRPTLCQGQNEDLKIDTGRVRYWVERTPGSQMVSVEHLVAGRWLTLRRYWGGPTTAGQR